MPSDHRTFSFTSLGRLTVRFRWIVVVAWIVGTALLTLALPGISGVEKSSNTQFIPTTMPSEQAARLAAPFRTPTTSEAVLVAATSSGRFSTSDIAAVGRLENAVADVSSVIGVNPRGSSADGRARQSSVTLAVPPDSTGPTAVRAVANIRKLIATASLPSDLAVHLTGPAAQAVDRQNQQGKTQKLTEILSVLFILLLLFFTFRALLAPFIALLPSAIALIAAEPLIAASTHLGVQVSDLTPVLLVVVMLGAGTDYGLFLIFRVREEIRRGMAPHDAVAFSLSKVGESITFSGLTVIAALATVVIATFGLYQGFGPALAIGIAMALLANLTLLPALLAICGRAVFWPRVPVAGQVTRGQWGRIASRVVGHPIRTLVLGLVILGALAAVMVAYSPTGFDNRAVPSASDSARGQTLLSSHFPAAVSDPTDVLFAIPRPVWDHPEALATAANALRASGQFSSVTSVLDANSVAVTPSELADAHHQLAAAGPAESLPLVPPPGYTGSPATYAAYRGSAQFISPDGRTLRYPTSLSAGPSTSTAAAAAIPDVRDAVTSVAHSVGATSSGVDGYAALAADIGSLSMHDLLRIIPIVMLVLALLLAIVLRSLIAPLYLVASVALSYLASLGFAVLVFVVIGGQDGINFVLPFFMFIFIMALGQDYNILVMTRIREEAHFAPIKVAVGHAVEATGTTVTSAGLILAGTFAVLTFTGDTQVVEIGVGLAAGILLDTFFVRTLLVPSVAVLLGRWNWWPSSLSSVDRDHGSVLPGPEWAVTAHAPAPIVGPGVDPAVEPGVDSEVDLGADPRVNSDVEPVVDPGVDSCVSPGVGPGVGPTEDPGVGPGVGPGVDHCVGTGVDPGPYRRPVGDGFEPSTVSGRGQPTQTL